MKELSTTMSYYLDLMNDLINDPRYSSDKMYIEDTKKFLLEKGYLTQEQQLSLNDIWESIYS